MSYEKSDRMFPSPKESDIVAKTMDELQLADVPIKHSSELIYTEHILYYLVVCPLVKKILITSKLIRL